ncbi:MAG: cobyrinate a,c-diamide synthase [Verrucomicrobiota bacterium]
MSGLILGGLQSSSGKTVVTSVLLAALAKQGKRVQPFKAGPDFIDPAYHSLFGERSSRNLDFWLMGGEEAVKREALGHTVDCPGILEGVMGIFDGWTPSSDSESTMHLARLLDWPIVLVAPCAKAGRSLGAALRGFMEEAGRGRIAGVILNQVSGDSHRDYLKEAIHPLGIPVLGALPVNAMMKWPERHLGLQAAQEGDFCSADDLASVAEAHLDVEALWELAAAGEPGAVESSPSNSHESRLTLAVAQDEAFHFYYRSNLDQFDVVPFSPLRDRSLPEGVDALALGGGFPEVFAEPLSENLELMKGVWEAIADGLPVVAECGGLMYLAEKLTVGERDFPMSGVVPGTIEMTNRLQHFGYCTASSQAMGAVTGHEFHHSRWLSEETCANGWEVTKRRSGRSRREGFRVHQLQATYVHSMWTPELFLPDTV